MPGGMVRLTSQRAGTKLAKQAYYVGCGHQLQRRATLSRCTNPERNASVSTATDEEPVDQSTLTATIVAPSSANSPDIETVSKLRVAFQGVPGAYSEQATLQACPGCEPIPCQSFAAAFDALTSGNVDRACLPVENSLGGSIHAVLDLLLQHEYCQILNEHYEPIHHYLLALPGSRIEDIKMAISHPQALAQVRNYLQRLGIARKSVYDTAGAAEMVASQQLHGVAAVASSRAAQLYGLEPLAASIQDNKSNFTRFLIIAREPQVQDETSRTPSSLNEYKTSIMWTLATGPGALYRALSCFAIRGIDMMKIESRPVPYAAQPIGQGTHQPPKGGFSFVLYVDFLGSVESQAVQVALKRLQWEHAPDLQVFGTYPRQYLGSAQPTAAAHTPATVTPPPQPTDMSLYHYLSDMWNSANIDGGPLQRQPLVAFYGSLGTHGWQVADGLFPESRSLPCDSFESTIQALEQWKADVAVLPIETTIWGSVHEVYDLLINHNVHIVGEVLVPTRYCLAAPPEIELDQVQEVLGHELSLGQCQDFLRDKSWKQLPSAVSSGRVAAGIQERQKVAAMVTVPQVAHHHGLRVLATNIQDSDVNVTRFVLLSRTPNVPHIAAVVDVGGSFGSEVQVEAGEAHKASLVFSLNNGPGVLYTALSVFASRNIDMSKIESRPLRLSPLVGGSSEERQFNYLFYIDCLSSVKATAMKFALMDLADLAPQLRILGSYHSYVMRDPTSAGE